MASLTLSKSFQVRSISFPLRGGLTTALLCIIDVQSLPTQAFSQRSRLNDETPRARIHEKGKEKRQRRRKTCSKAWDQNEDDAECKGDWSCRWSRQEAWREASSLSSSKQQRAPGLTGAAKTSLSDSEKSVEMCELHEKDLMEDFPVLAIGGETLGEAMAKGRAKRKRGSDDDDDDDDDEDDDDDKQNKKDTLADTLGDKMEEDKEEKQNRCKEEKKDQFKKENDKKDKDGNADNQVKTDKDDKDLDNNQVANKHGKTRTARRMLKKTRLENTGRPAWQGLDRIGCSDTEVSQVRNKFLRSLVPAVPKMRWLYSSSQQGAILHSECHCSHNRTGVSLANPPPNHHHSRAWLPKSPKTPHGQRVWRGGVLDRFWWFSRECVGLTEWLCLSLSLSLSHLCLCRCQRISGVVWAWQRTTAEGGAGKCLLGVCPVPVSL